MNPTTFSSLFLRLPLTSIILLLALLTSINLHAAGKPPLGINTNEVMQVDSSVPFLNLFKQALPFDESRKLTRGNISYDPNGWPRNLNGGVAGTYLIHWLPAGTIPDGNYTVLYDGEGTLEYCVEEKAIKKPCDVKLISKTRGKEIIQIRAGHDKFFKVTLSILTNTKATFFNQGTFTPVTAVFCLIAAWVVTCLKLAILPITRSHIANFTAFTKFLYYLGAELTVTKFSIANLIFIFE